MKKKDPDWEHAKDFAVRMLGLYVVIAIVAFVFIALGSCASSKPKVVERVKTEVRTETIFVRDTLTFEIPAQSSERVTRDSTSYLETDYAVSTASILSDGSLFHELRNKARKMEIPFLKPVKSNDSIVYRDKEIPVPYEVPVEVVKPLSWWQQTQIRGFWAFLALFALFVGVKYRNLLLSLLKRVV